MGATGWVSFRRLIVVGAALGIGCASFGSSDPPVSNKSPPDGGSDRSLPAEGLDGSGGSDTRDATRGPLVTSVQCGDSRCSVPQFCCVSEATPPTCVGPTGCVKTGEAPIRCDDERACPDSMVCCLRQTNFHLTSIVCESSCTGPGAYVRCTPGQTACPTGTSCISLDDVAGGQVHPQPGLLVCASL
jgi:hypothetical protein